jgi:hypothetical protein
MKQQKNRMLLALAVSAAFAAASTGVLAASKTYTLDADFALGLLSGVNYDAPNSNQLQLSAVGTTFPVMWIANAGEDTVSKFDTTNNVELARYRTWFGPAGQTGHRSHLGGAYSGPAPSRTAVDISGNAYVLNRFFENKRPVLLKILAEGFIDRNGNGVMDTSSSSTPTVMGDLNGNDQIDPNEITDERIAWAVQVGSQNGLGRSLCIGTDGHLWVGMYNARTYYKAGGGVLVAVRLHDRQGRNVVECFARQHARQDHQHGEQCRSVHRDGHRKHVELRHRPGERQGLRRLREPRVRPCH